MRTFPPLAMLALAVLAGPSPCATQSAGGDSPRTFQLASDPTFAHYRAPLLAYLHSQHAAPHWQVCILGEQAADGTRWAWVIWPRGRKMILWGGGTASLIDSRRILDLDTDVVATESQLHGSTYRVTRAWVARQAARCRRDGLTVTPAMRESGR